MIKCLSVLFVSFLFLMTGCAPKVITNISKSYPASVTVDKVRLYELGEAVPASAERIGNVSVVDNGVSTKCNYDQVVWLAKQETAKAGGNALALTDHRKPSLLGSSCHQIAGSMLLVSDTAAFRAAPLSKALDLEEEAVVEKSSFEHNTIYANIGYAFVTSKFYLPPGGSGHPKNGLDWQVGYDWISRSGFGAGLLYSGYKSSYTYSGIDINVGLTYVAPQFVMKQIINRWIVEEKIVQTKNLMCMEKTTGTRTGRKPKSDPADRKYSFRLNAEENTRFEKLLADSGVGNLTLFIKKSIFSGQIKVVKIDKATMDYYIRLTEFHKQFQAVGNNYNQVVRALKNNFGEKRAMSLLYRLEKLSVELMLLCKKITALTQEYERKWLQR